MNFHFLFIFFFISGVLTMGHRIPPVLTQPSSLQLPSAQISNSSFKSNTTTSILLPIQTKLPPIPQTRATTKTTQSPTLYSLSSLKKQSQHHPPPSPPPLLPTSAALIAVSPFTSSLVAASAATVTNIASAPLKSKSTIANSSRSRSRIKTNNNSNNNNKNNNTSSSTSPLSHSIASNETKLDIQPNFLIKQPVPNISSSYFRSSSINSHPVRHNDSDTDFFVSDKTKNYSKLIYQDINIESFDDDFGDHHNNVDNDSDNNSDSDDSASRNTNGNNDDDNDNDENDNFSVQLKNNMYFGTSNYTIVSAQIGSPVDIPCTVHNIGESVVSFAYFHIHITFLMKCFSKYLLKGISDVLMNLF